MPFFFLRKISSLVLLSASFNDCISLLEKRTLVVELFPSSSQGDIHLLLI
uniref:Uncharacterized protein n=1 Tax=Rhizophora mucronata TaxID=61149 RepID=A0A2P2QBD1_RHIMU